MHPGAGGPVNHSSVLGNLFPLRHRQYQGKLSKPTFHTVCLGQKFTRVFVKVNVCRLSFVQQPDHCLTIVGCGRVGHKFCLLLHNLFWDTATTLFFRTGLGQVTASDGSLRGAVARGVSLAGGGHAAGAAIAGSGVASRTTG